MRIGVMADSHDCLPKVLRAVEVLRSREVVAAIHAGDFVAPFAARPLEALGVPVYGVLGNNDGERRGLARTFEAFGSLADHLLERELGGRRIAAVHYPELAGPLFRSGAYDLVVCGHTHEVALQRDGDRVLLNPGEVGGWLTGRSTLAVVDLPTLAVEILDL